MKPISTVYLCGPIAEPGKPARGGYQSRNLRTIEALRSRGIEVHALPYAQPDSSPFRKLIAYAMNFTFLAFKVGTLKKRSILHITSLRRIFLYPELALIFLAKLRQCKTIYDIRDGLELDTAYLERSATYRWCFARALRAVDLIMVQGESQKPFVELYSGITPILLPNQVELSSIPERSQSNTADQTLKIAYAGGLKTEKGIATILETAKVLGANGVKVTVHIAGTGDEKFVTELRQRYADLQVDWMGAQPTAAVLELFSTTQFFVFPTWWPGEGQSNALTEAMACGCVPVVSDHGFNATTVGRCGPILSTDASPQQYASAIQEIWEGGQWAELSRMSADRVRRNFSSTAVIDHLVDQYSLLERNVK